MQVPTRLGQRGWDNAAGDNADELGVGEAEQP
jgi:hypothetical protein